MNQFIIKNGLVLGGGAIQGLGMGLFLFPNSIPSGGSGGIAILLNYWFGISTGLALWIANFSLLLLGIKYFGKAFVLWTIIGITVTSVSVQFFEQYVHVPERNLVFDLVLGSTFLGIGVGMLMRQNVSNGGVGVVAMIIASGREILPGKPLFYINCFVFLITAMVIDWKIIFLAFCSQWISTKVVDYVCSLTFHQTYTLGWRKK
ncbi:YitT family protein [Lentibacillus sp. N15]|uniref:YitT family protein n=1 Tax=Lentibacillus songyuanensis TaxID=3136161 RepID=UPI0031B9E7EB